MQLRKVSTWFGSGKFPYASGADISSTFILLFRFLAKKSRPERSCHVLDLVRGAVLDSLRTRESSASVCGSENPPSRLNSAHLFQGVQIQEAVCRSLWFRHSVDNLRQICLGISDGDIPQAKSSSALDLLDRVFQKLGHESEELVPVLGLSTLISVQQVGRDG